MATLDDLNKTVAEMRDVLANNKNADGSRDKVLDENALVATFTKALNDWQKTMTAENIRKGEHVGPIGNEKAQPFVKGGKFDGQKTDDVLFTHYLLSKAIKSGQQNVAAPSDEMKGIVSKALTATGAGTGDEYVPTGMASTMWQDALLDSRVASQFATVAMPTDPWVWPLSWGAITFRRGTQNTATTVSDPPSASSTFTASELVAEVDFSYNLDEDSIIAVMPSLRTDFAVASADYIDKFVMNADSTNAGTGNINLDDADPDDDSYYLSLGQDGLRHQILVDNTGQAADVSTTLTDALLRTGIGKLGSYGVNPDRLVMFTNPKTYLLSMLGLTNVVTADKFGAGATVLTGQLANYGGIAVIPTNSISLAEDDGKVSTVGANNDEGTIVIAHRDMWKVAYKRQFTLEVFRDVQKRMVVMVGSFRIAVGTRGTRSTNTHTAGVFGITY